MWVTASYQSYWILTGCVVWQSREGGGRERVREDEHEEKRERKREERVTDNEKGKRGGKERGRKGREKEADIPRAATNYHVIRH